MGVSIWKKNLTAPILIHMCCIVVVIVWGGPSIHSFGHMSNPLASDEHKIPEHLSWSPAFDQEIFSGGWQRRNWRQKIILYLLHGSLTDICWLDSDDESLRSLLVSLTLHPFCLSKISKVDCKKKNKKKLATYIMSDGERSAWQIYSFLWS